MNMTRLLGDEDPSPVVEFGPSATQPGEHGADSPFLFVSDHAGRAMPARLGDLGVADEDRARHIAWDIGIAGMGRALAGQLDSLLIEQAYSRLVIDCNRAPGHPTSIVRESDGTQVPGNHDLSVEDEGARVEEIFHPYHNRIATELSARSAAGLPVVVVALHSFTPQMNGVSRPWHAGVLHNRNPAFGLRVRDFLAREEGLVIGNNEPYALTDVSDYTIPTHAEGRGLAYLELEVRQDLIATEEGQREWARRLARILPQAWEGMGA
ncbi:N-formylglutamate amidohydrolase [Novacetimonas maltaceti]|uniref:N-formylglutamate amidohydrolase n=1 Tax=Novacetimonas maltaceti TaxID=1203393 RepID=A0A2S3W556_9PROT|nr:N-formylglutamate amidohydrolase [Novacetimonas maltaceti]POF64001.1 N-formylglutamate amidohydrolase [Novacetimonas maltaceti]PYD62193.1 N-formylglutamate amidohydrolase [Novacetimonas maltaceti]